MRCIECGKMFGRSFGDTTASCHSCNRKHILRTMDDEEKYNKRRKNGNIDRNRKKV